MYERRQAAVFFTRRKLHHLYSFIEKNPSLKMGLSEGTFRNSEIPVSKSLKANSEGKKRHNKWTSFDLRNNIFY